MWEYTYCFILYFGVESDLLLSFFRLCPKPTRRGSWGSIPRIVPSGSFLSSYIYHLFIIYKQKTYITFVSYGILVLNQRLSSPFLFSIVGMAEVLGSEPTYGCYVSLLFIYLNSSFPIFMESLSHLYVFLWLENVIILKYNKCSKLTLTQKIKKPHTRAHRLIFINFFGFSFIWNCGCQLKFSKRQNKKEN